MPSLLENLQRRLDDLPVPDILHRPHANPAQEVAAGLEASPRLRVRAFPQQPPAQPRPVPAANAFVRPQRIPSSQQQPSDGQGSSTQPALLPTQAGSRSVHASMLVSDAWLADLPDTPEAPRAATAAQQQAVADLLFEDAAAQSAVADSETLSEDPSWLSDAAAYDVAAAAAEMDDDLSALDVLSDNDDTPVNAIRSQARHNLSHLEHLMLLSDSEEEADLGMTVAPDRHGPDVQSPFGQAARVPSGNAGPSAALSSADSHQVSRAEVLMLKFGLAYL